MTLGGASPDGDLSPADIRLTDSPVPRCSFPWINEPELSVVIVSFGTGAILDRCLDEACATIAADGVAAEVILVDNLHPRRGHVSGDRTAISTCGVRLLQPTENLGFGGGNNAGVGAARAPMVALLNPDALLAPGQLRALLDAARSAPDFITAPAFVYTDGSLQEVGMRIISNGETRPILDVGSHDVDYASAACWLFSTALFERLGGFDDAYHPAYYEDVDFALRVAEAGGGTQLVDTVRVVHEHQGSTTEAPDVDDQQRVFVERWSELLATRPSS